MKIVPILPKNFNRLNSAKYQQALEKALDKSARGTVEDMKAVVRGWNHAPSPSVKKTAFAREVTIDDERWTWLDKGTKPHIIRARKRFLVFQAGYRAKTAPGRLSSTGGGASGPTVFAKVVRHPGIKARNWTQRLAVESQERTAKLVRQAISEVANG